MTFSGPGQLPSQSCQASSQPVSLPGDGWRRLVTAGDAWQGHRSAQWEAAMEGEPVSCIGRQGHGCRARARACTVCRHCRAWRCLCLCLCLCLCWWPWPWPCPPADPQSARLTPSRQTNPFLLPLTLLCLVSLVPTKKTQSSNCAFFGRTDGLPVDNDRGY